MRQVSRSTSGFAVAGGESADQLYSVEVGVVVCFAAGSRVDEYMSGIPRVV